MTSNRSVTLEVPDQIAPAMPANAVVMKSRERTLERPPLPHEIRKVIAERPDTDKSRRSTFQLLDEHLDSGREAIDMLPIGRVHNEVPIVSIRTQPAVEAIRQSGAEI